MQESKQANQCFKRIAKDLKELERSPLKGVGICTPDQNNPRHILVNIEVQEGPYKGMVVHQSLIIPVTYPTKAPKMIIHPGQPFDYSFHGHIHQFYSPAGSDLAGVKIEPDTWGYCIDILDTVYFGDNLKTGWSPAYTFKTLFMQLQIFLSDPDYWTPTKTQVQQIWTKLDKYQKKYATMNGIITHSNKSPFPPLSDGVPKQQEIDPKALPSEIQEKLTCYMTRDSLADSTNIILGYPLYVSRERNNKLNIQSFSEILSLEGYEEQNRQKIKQGSQMKTASGQLYNTWIPLFLTEDHFKRAQKFIFSQIAIILDQEFHPEDILEIFPNILNKLTVRMFDSEGNKSISLIEMYCQFQTLFSKLVKHFSKQLVPTINYKIENAFKNDYNRHKKQIPDIGEFLLWIGQSEYPLQDILPNIYREYYARQIFWLFKKNPSQLQNNQKILQFAFQNAEISNNLLMFNLKSQQILGTPQYLDSIADRCSFISQEDAQNFQDEMKSNLKNIKSHIDLWKYIGLINIERDTSINLKEYEWDWYQIAVYVSNQQGYTKSLDTHLKQNYKFRFTPHIFHQELFDFYQYPPKKYNKNNHNEKMIQKMKEKLERQKRENAELTKKQEQTENPKNLLVSVSLDKLEEIFKSLNEPHDIYVEISKQDLQIPEKLTDFLVNSSQALKEKFSIQQLVQNQNSFLINAKAPRGNAQKICEILIQNDFNPQLLPRKKTQEVVTFLQQQSQQQTQKQQNTGEISLNLGNINEIFENLNAPHDIKVHIGDKIKTLENLSEFLKEVNSDLQEKYSTESQENYFIVKVKPPRKNALEICLSLLKNNIQHVLVPRVTKK